MKTLLTLKNVEFAPGTGKKPVICVPVMSKTTGELINDVSKAVFSGADMVEWRADAFTAVMDLAAVFEALKAVKDIVKDTVFLFTLRSAGEHGYFFGGTDQYFAEIEEVDSTGICDICDIEYQRLKTYIPDPKKAKKYLKNLRSKVILSLHDFDRTPPSAEMFSILSEMRDAGADMVKLAVMPKDHSELMMLLLVTERFSKAYPDTPCITVSMGETGFLSRLTGQIFGSTVTYAGLGDFSAPGQLSYFDTKGVVNLFDRYFGEKKLEEKHLSDRVYGSGEEQYG